MSENSGIPPKNDASDPSGSSQYDLWFDGLLDDARSRREAKRVMSDPAQRARFETDRAVEESLRRSFGTSTVARRGPVELVLAAPLAQPAIPWVRYALAAGVLALFGAALATLLARHGDVHQGTPGSSAGLVQTKPASIVVEPGSRAVVHPRLADFSLGDVFLDALAFEFQPQLGCQTKDRWDAELFAQLETAPCNQEQGVVVLGEWLDPRVNVANMVMLRRGENPIMLVVPRCGQETEMCVAKDSGLYVHRGMRDGRAIFEISPLPDSEVLSCVDAQSVVTQQQL